LHRLFDTPVQQKLRALSRESDELDATHPGAPPRGMVLVDNDSPTTPHIFKRGNPSNQGPEVPRQFPAILAGTNREPFKLGSGRLEFARAIASTNNPLTARVFVNRVWLAHFGSALVRTPSDFGLRSDPPTNPALLDFLASRFMQDGWSIKKLHRLIMLSSAYQQSSDDNPAGAKIDSNNDYYWRMNRQRLDFEGLRDSLLAVSKRLNPEEGGRAVDIVDNPEESRRTIYGFIDRQNLPGLMRTFDFATPDTSSAQRFNTTVPQQALFMMNSPFVVLQARALAAAIPSSAASDEAKVRWLYDRLYQRSATAEEIALAESFLKKVAAEPPLPNHCWTYGYGEYSTSSSNVTQFTALPRFADETWKGGDKLPDPKLGWVSLTANGGHPGEGAQHAAIRRWTAPYDGEIRVEGKLGHESDKGDGVRGRLVSSRVGLLGEWTVHHSDTPTALGKIAVKRGDTIDFVTDMRASLDSDSFSWPATIRYLDNTADSARPGMDRTWDSAKEFAGPAGDRARPLGPWGKYAQVLLLSNEFAFVD
jgi:hypothetical protein